MADSISPAINNSQDDFPHFTNEQNNSVNKRKKEEFWKLIFKADGDDANSSKSAKISLFVIDFGILPMNKWAVGSTDSLQLSPTPFVNWKWTVFYGKGG